MIIYNYPTSVAKILITSVACMFTKSKYTYLTIFKVLMLNLLNHVINRLRFEKVKNRF